MSFKIADFTISEAFNRLLAYRLSLRRSKTWKVNWQNHDFKIHQMIVARENRVFQVGREQRDRRYHAVAVYASSVLGKFQKATDGLLDLLLFLQLTSHFSPAGSSPSISTRKETELMKTEKSEPANIRSANSALKPIRSRVRESHSQLFLQLANKKMTCYADAMTYFSVLHLNMQLQPCIIRTAAHEILARAQNTKSIVSGKS